jgi:hypothetical protein
VQHVDERDDDPQSRHPRPDDLAQPEQHPQLVLLDHPHRHGDADNQQHHHDDGEDNEDFHGAVPFRLPVLFSR